MLIDATRTFVGREDSEVQTVTGYGGEELVALLAAVEAKVLSRTS